VNFIQTQNERLRLIAPCRFGLEAVLKNEIKSLGYEITEVDDGRVTFEGGTDAIPRANIFIRSAERILLSVGSFKARTFEELFDNIAALNWERYIPVDGKFWVTKAASKNSKLFSPSDIQSIVKKAMVRSLEKKYGISRFPEDGNEYPVRIFIKKDVVTAVLDTTGVSLHKRGYRKIASKAPLAENLAAALLQLARYKGRQPLADPFCGSGTFPIEAAMMAANIAPGMNREFTSDLWTNLIPNKLWYAAYEEARDLVDMSVRPEILGCDIDEQMIKIAGMNAHEAGVRSLVKFRQCAVKDFVREYKGSGDVGIIITNPPYGVRLMDKKELSPLYRELGSVMDSMRDWSSYVITSYDDMEKIMGKKAAKNRKIYNGEIRTYFYSFPAAVKK